MVAAVAGMLLGAACPQAQADGTVWAWGYNGDGRLGDGTKRDTVTPVPAPDLTGMTAVSAGTHGLALRRDGAVLAWGHNGFGQLGDNSTTDRQSPVRVGGLTVAVAVAAGPYHSLALGSDGTVWAWGRNSSGQLGDGTVTDRWSPNQVAGLSNITGIACGFGHSLALKSDGTVWAWGGNGSGEIGDGTQIDRLVPVHVDGVAGATAVAGGMYHSLALKSDGTVWAWGQNSYGELGNGTMAASFVPVRVVGLAGVRVIASGWAYHSLALDSDGSVWAWGYNAYGQAGDGTFADRLVPGRVPGIAGIVAIARGRLHSLALGADGRLFAWGFNGSGELGDGTTASRTQPVLLSSLGSVTGTAAGWACSFALVTPFATSLYSVDRTGTVTGSVRLKAYLKRTTDNAWVAGRGITFGIGGTDVGAGATDASGMAHLDWVIADGQGTRAITARFGGDPSYAPSTGTASLTALTHDTSLYVPNRSAEIADAVLLKAYLYWGPLHLPKLGKTVSFSVAGTAVGSAVTNEGGRAMLSYSVPEGAGPGLRSLVADWPGDGGYRASSATATLDVAKAPTYLWLASRSAQITKQTYLRAYLRRLPDYVWLPGKAVRFALDGTALGSEATDSGGRASYLYTVSAALGDHPMGAAFDGDGSYLPGGSTGVLTVVP
jgi:alpha-tubulin suppressor-like RCC1 family protein